jgi:hypothetical protein
MRLRTFLIMVGAVLIAAVYTFPVWQPLLDQRVPIAADAVIPGLPADLAQTFAILPAEQQAAYRAVAEIDPLRGLAMVSGALAPRQPAPDSDRELPGLINPAILAVGAFGRIDPVRWGQGEITIYASQSAPPLLRLDNFSVANAPDLRIALVVRSELLNPTPLPEGAPTPVPPRIPGTVSALDPTSLLQVGALKGVYGNQNFNLPANFDFTRYDRVIIYSGALDMIYSEAALFIRG